MLRFILDVIIAILYLLLTLPVLGILTLIGKHRPDIKDRATKAMIQWIFRVLVWGTGSKVTVLGRENIPKDRSALFIGNHRNIFDIIATYPHMPRITGYVAKDTLNSIPVFNVWARNIHCLFFNRNDLKEGMKMILNGIAMLKKGESVFVFPEGTRNKNEQELPLLPFHDGSFRMAVKSGCPVVPVAITNMAAVWDGHSPRITPAHIIIEYGVPVETASLSKDQQKKIGSHVRELLEEMIAKNEELL